MKRLLLLLFWFGTLSISMAQSMESDNLVPNPSFEEYSNAPIGWYYRGAHFTNVMRYWSSATAASPDAFGPKVRVPEHWQDKGFGDQYAYDGESMVGITLYGCDKGKPHCREYVQVQLLESLVPEQIYYLEFWTVSLPRSLQTNNLGVYFSEGKMDVRVDEPIFKEPHFNMETIIQTSNHNWVKISGQFTAQSEADYILIGNFFPDSLTQTVLPEASDALKFAYYYLDNFTLKKVPPILNVPLAPDDLSLLKLEEGRIFQLKNIFFDSDKAELLPRSYQELKKLLHIMQQHPQMEIEIRGHTDSQGQDTYNSYLSRKRAHAVASYLWQNGIDRHRVHHIGLGSERPIASNATETGRKLNRRVEFLILKY